ncbi:MAG: tetratricopeptide repeat protein, partial [Thermoguttaceae bacterium]
VPNYVKTYAALRKELALLHVKTKRFQDAERELHGIIQYLSDSAAAYPRQAANLRFETAVVATELGRAYAVADRWNDAESAFQRAAEIYQELASENPDAASYQVERIRFQLEVGCLYLQHKRLEAAETYLSDAQVLAESRRRLVPDDDAPQAALADIHVGLAQVHFAQGDSESAERDYTTAIEFGRSLLETAPDPKALENRIAVMQHSLWVVRQANCQFAQAKTAALEAARTWIRNLEGSDDPESLERVVWSCATLGDEALEHGDLEEGSRLYTRVIEQRNTLLESTGDPSSRRRILSRCYRGRARIYAQAGELQKASDDWDAAVALAEGTQRDLYVVERPVLQALSGAYGAAASEVRELLQQYPPDHPVHVVAAGVLVQAGRSVANDDSRSENNRSESAEAFFLEATHILQNAYDLELFEVPSTRAFLGDPDFDPVRARNDFKAILQGVASAAKSQKDEVTPDAAEH